MRKLTGTICLTLAVLLGSGEVRGSDLYVCGGTPKKVHSAAGFTEWDNCLGKFIIVGQTKFAGNMYMGDFRNGIMHGQGTYTFSNGNKYTGEFKNGIRHGFFNVTYADVKRRGHKYVGEYKNDKRHGQGTYTHADGTVQEGIWKNGIFQYAQKASPITSSNTDKMGISQSKAECKELGLKPKTEKFGECVLQRLIVNDHKSN